MRRVASVVMLTLLLVGMLILTFNVQPVKADPETQLLLETDKPVYKLGEDVITTITNISNETIPWVGRWPVPWDIFTYPENRCVFAAFPCYCIFELVSGENVSYTWNQSDIFTIPPVEPGIYEVRDNQAWGLSICFRIVNAEIIVPDDYPTIQKAINAASDGGTIFVRNGTYYEHVIVNKEIALIGENKKGTIIDGQNSGIPLEIISSDNVVIMGFTFTHSNGDGGLTLTSSSNCLITDNIAEFGLLNGIVLRDSSNNNVISYNWVRNNTYDGIALWRSDSNNTIARNIVAGNRVYGMIIHTLSNNNTIAQNKMVENGGCGIVIDSSMYNWVFKNEIAFNKNNWYTKLGAVGLVYSSSNNVIFENNIKNNSLAVSTWLLSGSGNQFYHNSLIDNAIQTYIEGTCVWDNGCEGNYWSNYDGTDLDGDGIGDTYLPWEGVDYYPLMNFYWNPADIDHDLDVDIFDVVTACNAYGSTPSDPNWNPHCDIAEPFGVIDIFDIVMIAGSYGEEYNP